MPPALFEVKTMTKAAILARLGRLEAQKRAVDLRKPSIEELQAEARGEPVRPVVAALAARMRAYGREIEAATLGFSRWPRA